MGLAVMVIGAILIARSILRRWGQPGSDQGQLEPTSRGSRDARPRPTASLPRRL
jgi:hypothetical protein